MKKRISMAMAILLCLSIVLTACGKEGNGKGGESNSPQGGQTAGATGDTGKYVQQDVTPAQLEDGAISQIRQLADGSIMVIGANDGQMPAAYVTKDGDSWEAFSPITGAGILNDYSGHSMTYTVDDNGAWWIAAYTEAGDDNHLFKIANGGHEEINIGLYNSGRAGIVADIIVGNDNTILLCTMVGERIEWTTLDCANGEEIASFSAGGFFPTFTAYRDSIVYAAGATDAAVYTFDATSGQQQSTVNLPLSDSDTSRMIGDISSDNSVNIVNANGLYKVALGGDFLQTVIDNRSYAFADATFNSSKLCAADDGSFWLVGWRQNTSKVYRFVFDDDAPVVASSSLYVWAMESNSLLQLAISSFSQSNPECEVIVEFGRMNDSSAQTDEDIIRALNAQMLAGDIPDVLIVDDLPIESMIRQGLLSDLSGLLDEDDYYSGVLSSFTREGKTYAYPAMFWPVIMAQSGAASGPNVQDIKTFEQLGELLTDPNAINFGGYYHLFETLYITEAHNIFPGGTSLDKDALYRFMDLTKRVVDAGGLTGQEYCPIYGYDFMGSTLQGADRAMLPPDPSLSYFAREDGLAPDYTMATLFDYGTSVIWLRDRGQGVPIVSPVPGNVFLPTCIVAVPQGVKNEETARQFVKMLFECQTAENLMYMPLIGFSAKKGLELEMWRDRENEPRAEGVPPMPSADDLDLERVLEQLSTPGNSDVELHNKLYEQAKLLYNDSISVDEAVAAVEKNTELYFAERN